MSLYLDTTCWYRPFENHTIQARIDEQDAILTILEENKESIQIEAKCMWSKNDINPVLFDSGFQFLEVNSDDLSVIEDLLLHVSFDD